MVYHQTTQDDHLISQERLPGGGGSGAEDGRRARSWPGKEVGGGISGRWSRLCDSKGMSSLVLGALRSDGGQSTDDYQLRSLGWILKALQILCFIFGASHAFL